MFVARAAKVSQINQFVTHNNPPLKTQYGQLIEIQESCLGSTYHSQFLLDFFCFGVPNRERGWFTTNHKLAPSTYEKLKVKY